MGEKTEEKMETEEHPALEHAEIALTQLERACEALRYKTDKGEEGIVKSRLKQARTSALAALRVLELPKVSELPKAPE